MITLPLAAAMPPSQLVNPDSVESAFVSTGRFLLSLSAMLFLAYLFMLVGCAVLAMASSRRRPKHRGAGSMAARRGRASLRSHSGGSRVDAGASKAA
jgi:hypothetical protein